MNWLWKEWANVLRVRNNGVPIVGFTWYSLTDQVDWDIALRENNGHGQPARSLRPRPQHPPGRASLQEADRGLARGAADPERVPACPVVLPSEYDEPLAEHLREAARKICQTTPTEPSVGA